MIRSFRSVTVLLISLLFTVGCGGGGSNESSSNPVYFNSAEQKETQLITDVWNQGNQSVAYGAGVYLVVFEDDRENASGMPGGEDIWASLIDPATLTVIKEFALYRAPGRDLSPQVIFDPNTNLFVVTWTSYGSSLSSSGIMAATIDRSGNTLQTKALMIATGYGSEPIVRNTQDGYMFMYKDRWTTGDSNVGISVAKVAITDKQLVVRNIQAVSPEKVNDITVTPLETSFDCGPDSCVITYSMIRGLVRGSDEHVYARVLSLRDMTVGPEIQVTDPRAGGAGARKILSKVVYGGDRYLVMWHDWDSSQGGASTDLAGKYLYAADQRLSPTFLISDFRPNKSGSVEAGLGGMVYYSTAVYNPANNKFYGIWADSRSGTPVDTGLFIRAFNDPAVDTTIALFNNQKRDQHTPSAAIGSDGKMLITWSVGDDLYGLLYRF